MCRENETPAVIKAAWQLNSVTISTSGPEENKIKVRGRKKERKKKGESLKEDFFCCSGHAKFILQQHEMWKTERKWQEGWKRGKRRVCVKST